MNKKRLIQILVIIWILLQLVVTGYSFKKNIPFEIQSLLHKDNPIRLQYENDLKAFNDETINWIILEREKPFKISEIEALSQKLGLKLEMNYGVESILGPHNAKYFQFDSEGFSLVKFIKESGLSKEALEELNSDLWKNNLVRSDFRAFLVSFNSTSNLPRKEEQKVFNEITKSLHQLESENPGLHTGVLGAKAASVDFLQEMQFQQRVITPILLLVIVAFFFLCFRSWQIVAWSMFVLFVCYTTTLCLIIFVEGGLGPYSSFALMFAFIVATSDLIHFFGRLQQISGTIEERIQEALKISWFPCLLTSLTTSAGFFALIVNQNLPVRYFGLYCAFGCMLEWYIIYYILPGLLRAFNFNPNLSPYDSDHLSGRLQDYLNRFARYIPTLTSITLMAGVYFTTQLHIDDNFYTKFQDSHPLSRTLNIFSDEFDFVGSINVIVQPRTEVNGIYSPELHADLKQIETEVQANAKVSRITSLPKIYDNLKEKLERTSRTKENSVQENEAVLNLLYNYGTLSEFYNEGQKQYRFSVFLRSLASEDLESVLKTVEEVGHKYKDKYEIRPSGFSVIRSYINGQVIQDFFESFFISFVLIFICYYILYRSVKWSLLALIPNAVPLLAVSGLMGLFKVPIDSNLVILICIAFGISGDNTVHLTYVIQQQMKKGDSYETALKKAYRLIGIAIIGTSAAFIVCLPVFLLGSLRLFDHIAVFLSAAFIIAFLADAFVFPDLQKRLGWDLHGSLKTEKE